MNNFKTYKTDGKKRTSLCHRKNAQGFRKCTHAKIKLPKHLVWSWILETENCYNTETKMVRCRSGRTGSLGERVFRFAEPWVQIPPSPPSFSQESCGEKKNISLCEETFTRKRLAVCFGNESRGDLWWSRPKRRHVYQNIYGIHSRKFKFVNKHGDYLKSYWLPKAEICLCSQKSTLQAPRACPLENAFFLAGFSR